MGPALKMKRRLFYPDRMVLAMGIHSNSTVSAVLLSSVVMEA